MTPEQQAESYAYYRALVGIASNPTASSCIYDQLGNNPIFVSGNKNDVTASSILPGGYAWIEGKQESCANVLTNALNLWGISIVDFVQTVLGYKYDQSQAIWKTSTDKYGPLFSARHYLNNNIYNMNTQSNSAAPNLSAAGVYALNYATLTNGGQCQLKDLGPFSKLTDTQKASINNKDTFAVGSPTNSGQTMQRQIGIYTTAALAQTGASKPVKHGLTYVSYTESTPTGNYGGPATKTPTTAPIYGYNSKQGKGGITISCDDLVKGLVSNAQAYIYKGSKASLVGDTAVSGVDCTNDPSAASCATDDKPTCVVDGIGWILCPVMTLIGKITDQSYQVVQAFLTVKPLSTNTKDPLYLAWAMIRNFANVAFVLAFLVIIFSQLTSLGVSNYGIKKLLPRIVIAAILVNISYWICAVAVDLSNILGASLSDLFNGPTQAVMKNAGDSAGVLSGGNGWMNIVGGILGGTLLSVGLLYAGLSVLLPVLVAALCAIIAVVVVLVARQALIVLLIVMAPLAFVAYLLPNTESLFKRWFSLFRTLLLLYPIIALGYGVCKFAGALLMGIG